MSNPKSTGLTVKFAQLRELEMNASSFCSLSLFNLPRRVRLDKLPFAERALGTTFALPTRQHNHLPGKTQKQPRG
jgi:hypothetical protein